MSRYPFVRFVDVCDFQGGTQPPKSTSVGEPRSGYVRLLQIRDFNSDEKAVYIPDAGRLKKCLHDDILLVRYGASIGRVLTGKAGAYNVAIVKMRPQPTLDKRYLFHYLSSPLFQSFITNVGTRAAQTGFNRSDFSDLKILMPPLPEQRRIAAILDKADAIRRKRQETIRLTDEFLRSAFLDMFGDPVTNPKGWRTVRLGEVADFVGGGTPSRAVQTYFDGPICWATSKDMKGEVLTDTQEHITEEAVENSATKQVPEGTLLVVVKSKILMHRLPVLRTAVPACFSQDIKGILLQAGFPPRYVARHLRVGQRALLELARGANTEGLTLDHLRNYRLMAPKQAMLARFEQVETLQEAASEKVGRSRAAADDLFGSVTARALAGAL
jgi:type I restriction enzyme S subunit